MAQQRLVDSLRLLPAGLTSLQLDGCAIGPRGATALGTLLCEGAWPLRLGRLTLAHNPLGKDEGTVALAAALRCSHSLVELDLTHTQVELQPLLEALVSSAPLQRSLASLYLGTNKLPRPAAALLATFVGASSALGQLGLSRTQLPPDGLEASLAAALANTALPPFTLDASDNELGEKCARQLAAQLRAAADNTRGAIGAIGAIDGGAINGGAGGAGSLRGLKLRGAGLCEAGVAALLAPLAAHARLQTVDLSSNIRRRMLPWMDAAVDELGPALVALLTRCERLR